MRAHHNHPIAKYALILCLGTALLLAQTIKLHMHLQHDEISPSIMAEHTIGVHMAFSQHDTLHNGHYEDGIEDHHSSEIGVSSAGFTKKADLLNPFILLFFIISIIFYIPRLYRFCKKPNLQTERPPGYYLLHPPLRAPPV